jgi:arginyl-tRNA synthetase
MIKEQIRASVEQSLSTLINSQLLSSQALDLLDSMSIMRSKNPAHGDFALNIAMLVAKSEQKSPRDIAALIINELQKNTELYAQLNCAGPGFINITLSDAALSQIIPHVAYEKSRYGTSKVAKKQRALIEFVSANPTGGLHLGHARGAFVGDALARLFSAAGFLVTKEYYVNDAGNQVETLARTIHKRYRELFGEEIIIEKGEYPSESVKEIAQALRIRDQDIWLGKKEEEWLQPLAEFGVEYNLNIIKKSLDYLDINIDNWFKEHVLHEDGSLGRIVELYKTREMLYEADEAHNSGEKVRRDQSKAAIFSHLQAGGLFLKTSQFGDDEDRIIQRKDGRFVYLTADLAYHHEKFERGFDIIINVFGADHSGHIGRIKAGMQALGHDVAKLEFATVQMVRLLKDGQEMKFSKRAGEVISIDDMIDEIGKDVARFVFLMRAPSSQFDLDLALLTKQSHENPVFYVQYGHARMATILNKAQNISFDPEKFSIFEQQTLTLPEERDLLLKITELAEVVREAALALEPHRVIYYCQELIKSFHSYFTKYKHTEKIISGDIIKSQARLSLVFALKQTIFNALSFLGLSAPDHMEFSEAQE